MSFEDFDDSIDSVMKPVDSVSSVDPIDSIDYIISGKSRASASRSELSKYHEDVGPMGYSCG